jgi:hypothetical protein
VSVHPIGASRPKLWDFGLVRATPKDWYRLRPLLTFWSSADFGDANLLDTNPCATLEDAITTLRGLIADFVAALSDSPISG